MTCARTRSRLRRLYSYGALAAAVMHYHLAAAQQTQQQAAAAAKAAAKAPSSPLKASEPSRPATMMPIAPMLMPGCPNGDILNSLSTKEFPGRSWRSMSLEQQATHPINLVFLNLVGVPSTTRQGQFLPCLDSWGVKKSSVKRIKKDYRVGMTTMSTEVLVMRTSRDVFVVFRATDDDWVADFTCLYTDDLKDKFNAPKGLFSKKLQLHKGFWTAYSAVDTQLMNEIKAQAMMAKATNPFSSPQVWIVGHSLGAALGSIAALKLSLDPLFLGKVGGVVTYGMPRVGNEAWQSLYNDKLMDITVRFENFRDLFAELPGKSQVCPALTPTPGARVVYSFRHVGKAVQLCPDEATGMERFTYYPKGTEGECKETAGQRPSIATHLIGAYFDGWRRAYAYKNGIPAGLLLSTSLHVRSVMCSQCAVAVKPYPLPTNKAARNDGVTTCVNSKSCTDKFVFGLVSWSGLRLTSFWRPDATCDPTTLTCQVPIPGLEAVTNVITTLAPNLTLVDLAAAASALWQNGTGIKEQLQDYMLGASSGDDTASSSTAAADGDIVGDSHHLQLTINTTLGSMALMPAAAAVKPASSAKLNGSHTTVKSSEVNGAVAAVKHGSAAASGTLKPGTLQQNSTYSGQIKSSKPVVQLSNTPRNNSKSFV